MGELYKATRSCYKVALLAAGYRTLNAERVHCRERVLPAHRLDRGRYFEGTTNGWGLVTLADLACRLVTQGLLWGVKGGDIQKTVHASVAMKVQVSEVLRP